MKLSILYGCDNNYAPYTGVSMTSLFENNPTDDITVFLAAMDVSRENLERFSHLAERYSQRIVVLDTKLAVEKIISFNCGSWNGSLAAWLRFFVLDQIPKEVENLIWLDSDTIVGKNISDILSEDYSQMALGAVCDCISIRHRYRLGIDDTEPYYNSGVIVFNMPYWREHNTIQGMLNHLQKHVSRYLIPDQDMMNDYFRGKILKLPPVYNVQGFQFAYSVDMYFSIYCWKCEAYYSPPEIAKAIGEPIITHFFRFLGDYPWTQGRNYHPCKALYEEWKAKSLWKDDPGSPQRRELAFRIEKCLYCILPRKVFLRIFAWYTNRELPRVPLR